MSKIFLVILILFFLSTEGFCQNQTVVGGKPGSYGLIANHYSQFQKHPLNSMESFIWGYHLDRVEKFSQELRDYEAIGLLGNKGTVAYLKNFLLANENNPSSVYQSVCKYYIYCSLVLLGERQYIDDLLKVLNKIVPEYPELFKKGIMNDHDSWICSEVLKRLSEYGVLFDARHIDKIIEALPHLHNIVIGNADYVLNRIFVILFWGTEPTWADKPAEVRLPHIKAWEKFWGQNKNRYGSGLPLIINDLELQAQYTETNGRQLILTIINHGDISWDIFVEAAGDLDEKNPSHCPKWMGVFDVLDGENRMSPTQPHKYMITPASANPKEEYNFWEKTPDRKDHIEKKTILPGGSYRYVMDLAQAYPHNEFKSRKIYAEFLANPYRDDYFEEKFFEDAKVWKGELRAEIGIVK